MPLFVITYHFSWNYEHGPFESLFMGPLGGLNLAASKDVSENLMVLSR
jgi:hypothetical protein